jgi:hypothetical protein
MTHLLFMLCYSFLVLTILLLFFEPFVLGFDRLGLFDLSSSSLFLIRKLGLFDVALKQIVSKLMLIKPKLVGDFPDFLGILFDRSVVIVDLSNCVFSLLKTYMPRLL